MPKVAFEENVLAKSSDNSVGQINLHFRFVWMSIQILDPSYPYSNRIVLYVWMIDIILNAGEYCIEL